MKNLLKTFILIFVISLVISCDNDEISSEADFKIEFGSVCGWCAGEEFITVTNSQIEYNRSIPCGDDKGIMHKSRKITNSEWNEIISSFDYSLFKKLNYNTCNVCADGCDEIIRTTNNTDIHEIRYSPSDEIKETKELKQILTEILEEMRSAN